MGKVLVGSGGGYICHRPAQLRSGGRRLLCRTDRMQERTQTRTRTSTGKYRYIKKNRNSSHSLWRHLHSSDSRCPSTLTTLPAAVTLVRGVILVTSLVSLWRHRYIVGWPCDVTRMALCCNITMTWCDVSTVMSSVKADRKWRQSPDMTSRVTLCDQ